MRRAGLHSIQATGLFRMAQRLVWNNDAWQFARCPDMHRIGQVDGLIQRAALDVHRFGVTRALMPQSRSATAAERAFQRMPGGRLPCPERRLALHYLECVAPDGERDAERGRRLLSTFGAMANVQRQRLPRSEVPNISTLAAATLAFVSIPDCF